MDRGKIGFVVGLSAEARLLRGSGFMVGVGGGLPEGAARAAEGLISKGALALVSFGLAGGLNPVLRPGAILIPQSVIDDREIFLCDDKLLELLGGSNGNSITSAKNIAATTYEKTALFEHNKSRCHRPRVRRCRPGCAGTKCSIRRFTYGGGPGRKRFTAGSTYCFKRCRRNRLFAGFGLGA